MREVDHVETVRGNHPRHGAAGVAAGHNAWTLRKALKSLGVTRREAPGKGRWLWESNDERVDLG